MKKLSFLAVGVLMTAALAMTGCHKQSELEFNDIAESATVQGFVYINKGYIQDGGGNFAVLNEPAKGVSVVIKVDYKQYDGDAADGQKMFEGTCNDDGMYTITVPVGQKAISGMKAYTRPFVGEYFDLVNGAIQKVEVSYPEVSTSVDIERGKTFMAANMIVTKDVEKPILTRNQVVTVRGQLVEKFEKKEYIDPEDKDKGYNVLEGTQNATQEVMLTATFTNSDFKDVELVFNTKAAVGGAYEFKANLYDTWDISKTEVKIETKAYLNAITHYFKKYDEDEKKFLDKNQEVNGYFKSATMTKTLSDGDLLIGCTLVKLPMEFVPDYANEIIYGIGNTDIDIVKGKTVYTAANPLGWAY